MIVSKGRPGLLAAASFLRRRIAQMDKADKKVLTCANTYGTFDKVVRRSGPERRKITMIINNQKTANEVAAE